MSDQDDCRLAVLCLTFPSSVFSLDTLKRAAYKFTDSFSFQFDVEDDTLHCSATPLGTNQTDMDQFELRFRNEVLDQDLRERIAQETAPIRNVILAYAFSNTGLQDVEAL